MNMAQSSSVSKYRLNTVQDLLGARDHYHVHLSNLTNVVGTAIGRYLVHEKAVDHHPGDPERQTNLEKTLFNTVVMDWSWPCVLVFVNQWLPRSKFHKHPDEMVPSRLYLPDGRVVPTCVIKVADESAPGVQEPKLSFPRTVMGGGFLVMSEVQGDRHLGSVACLVTDGDLTYALTNRHVTGASGRMIETVMHDRRQRVGVSHANQIVCRPFVEMYPGWPGVNVQLQIDAGLIQIDDLASWTAEVAGMGALEEWMDLATSNLTLDLIDQNVRAFGAASGELRGKIAGLFYRYASAGGTEYVSDFLIRPASPDEPGTVHGDSGTLWVLEQREGKRTRLRPIAMQWGGHAWVDDQGAEKRTGRFALATSLSVVCRELGVRIVRDWNTGLPEYWGDVGHYTIGYLACDGMAGKPGALMKANQLNVSYPQTSIAKPGSAKGLHLKFEDDFVPLADVPDRLWAHGKMLRGSADGPNHFADMDRKDPKNQDKTLLELCEQQSNISPEFWLQYYDDVGVKSKQGLLPFRVWQFFDEMRGACKRKDVAGFVAAAGVCAHYVGDACQPLHCSSLHDGYEDGRGSGVHSAYEADMLKQHAPDLLSMLQSELKKSGPQIEAPSSGFEAAGATVGLMRRTFGRIQPGDIVDAFIQGKDLWDQFGGATVGAIADGVRTLQAIWAGAWEAGDGDQMAQASLGQVEHKALMDLYLCKTWMPSMSLATIGDLLKNDSSGSAPSGGTDSGGGAKKKPAPKKKAAKR